MIIIKIEPYDNGAHDNQTWNGEVPDGWAVVPEDMEVPESYPFVDIEVADDVVTAMTAREIPIPEEPEIVPSEIEQLRADVDFIALMTGVELI